jgi:hypothetical protein
VVSTARTAQQVIGPAGLAGEATVVAAWEGRYHAGVSCLVLWCDGFRRQSLFPQGRARLLVVVVLCGAARNLIAAGLGTWPRSLFPPYNSALPAVVLRPFTGLSAALGIMLLIAVP